MIRGKLLLSILSLIFAPMALLAANAVDLLEKAATADERVSYRGIKIATVRCSRGTVTATIKIVHLKPDKTRTEYYSPDPLAGIILIENGPTMWRFHPKENVWEECTPCRSISQDEIKDDLFKNYNIQLIGADEVAGRQVFVLLAIPKARGDWARRVWIDKESFLVLRSQVESAHGSIISSAKFVNIEINPNDISPSIFRVRGEIKPAKKPIPVKTKISKPAYLPPGYKLVSSMKLCLNGNFGIHLLYSNGVSTLSLFQSQSVKEVIPPFFAGKAINVISWAKDGVKYTLIGELERSELQKVANSIK